VSKRWLFRVLPVVAIVGLLIFHIQPLAHVHADHGSDLSFTPSAGAADEKRLVEFSGFNPGETVQLTFTDPSGASVTVNGYATFLASAQDDGTGAFFFRPADFLDALTPGQWTVTIAGHSEDDASATARFWIQQ